MSLSALEQRILDFIQTSFGMLTLSKKYGGTVLITTLGKQIGGVFVYKNHINITFSLGYLLADSDGILQGAGKFRRHLKIQNSSDIDWGLLKTLALLKFEWVSIIVLTFGCN